MSVSEVAPQQEASQERPVQKSLLLLTSKEPLDGHLRQQLAVALLERMKRIDDPIPTLSPSQRRWLESEREASKNNAYRLKNLVNSEEWLLDKAKNGSSQTVLALRTIVGGKASDMKQEVLLWTIVSYHFTDQIFWDSLNGLVERELVSQSFALDELDLEHLYPQWGRAILEKIVMPFLNGTLPE